MQRLSMMDMEVGSVVKVQWSGEWWEADVIDIKKSGDDIKAIKVRYHGSAQADEEWVEASSGRIKALGKGLGAGGVYQGDELQVRDSDVDDATWWRDIGPMDMNTDELLWDVLKDLHQGRMTAGERLLEIGAGAQSPLMMGDIPFKAAAGVGLLPEFIQKNPLFQEVHGFDYNIDERLPFDDGAFDTIIIPLKVRSISRPSAARTHTTNAHNRTHNDRLLFRS